MRHEFAAMLAPPSLKEIKKQTERISPLFDEGQIRFADNLQVALQAIENRK